MKTAWSLAALAAIALTLGACAPQEVPPNPARINDKVQPVPIDREGVIGIWLVDDDTFNDGLKTMPYTDNKGNIEQASFTELERDGKFTTILHVQTPVDETYHVIRGRWDLRGTTLVTMTDQTEQIAVGNPKKSWTKKGDGLERVQPIEMITKDEIRMDNVTYIRAHDYPRGDAKLWKMPKN